MNLYTSPDFVGQHANFPITSSHNTGGVSTKMTAVSNALNCKVITSLDGMQGDLVIEPLVVKAPRDTPEELKLGGDWEKLREIERGRIEEIAAYPYRKILLCSEMEFLRWLPDMQESMIKAVNNKVFASCLYQKKLFETVGVEAKVIYEPINEKLFYPSFKKKKQIVAIGSVKHIKGIERVIEFFKKLEGLGYHRVYVGSAGWSGKEHRDKERNYDIKLYNELKEVCDEFHEASPMTFVARILSESQFYVNFAFHEVCCRTAMEALMAGVGVIGGNHTLWNEYPVLARRRNLDACIEILEASSGVDTIPNKVRAWAVQNFSFPRFKNAVEREFYDY